MSIRLKRATEMLVAAVAVLVMSVVVVVVLLPGVAEAQGMDGAPVVEAGQNSSKQDAYYYVGALQQPPSEPATPLVVGVGAGDSLWSISQKHLGPEAPPEQIANEVERIFEVNREKIGDDPNLIFAGQELLLPSVSEPVPTSVPAETNEPVTSVPGPSQPVTTSVPAEANELAANVPAPSEPGANEPATTSASALSEPATNVPAPSEPGANEPAAGGAVQRITTTLPTLDERRLVGLGILVLTFVLVSLMAWKLPLKRKVPLRLDTRERAAAWAMPVEHPNYYVMPLRGDAEEDQYDIPQTVEGGKTFADKRNNFEHAGIARAMGSSLSSAPPVRTSGPRRLPRRGWATGVYSPQVRRSLKRPPRSTRGRRASPLPKKPSDKDDPS